MSGYMQLTKETLRLCACCAIPNRDAVFSINRGLQAVQGDYVLLGAADDWYDSNFIVSALKLLAKHPGDSGRVRSGK